MNDAPGFEGKIRPAICKPTPGPWRVDQIGDRLHVRAVDDLFGICSTFGTNAQHEANAALLRAAPELLAAAILGLEAAEMWISNNLSGTGSYDEAMADLQPIRDAIAKATGEPS